MSAGPPLWPWLVAGAAGGLAHALGGLPHWPALLAGAAVGAALGLARSLIK